MADDERRAEVEAVARVFADLDGYEGSSYVPAEYFGPAKKAIVALDRVRDGEGCPKCGKPSASPPAEAYCVDCATEGWEQDAAAHRAARSPQDEDCEAGR